VLVDAQRQETQHVFVEGFLTLQLLDRRSRGGDVQQSEMGLAILVDAIRQGLQAPRLDLGDGAALGGDKGLELLGERLDLLRGHVLTRNEHVLVKSHNEPFFVSTKRPR